MYEMRLVCLANSRKPPSGRCVAGKEYDGQTFGEWIRPVSARESHEVSEEERRYDGGGKAKLLDIVSIPLLKHSPQLHQTENHTLDDSYYWTKEGVATWREILDAEDDFDPAFWVAAQSTYHGHNDKVPEAQLKNLGSSLKLILVKSLAVVVRTEAGFEGAPGRRRVRARFKYKGTDYLLSLTDPTLEDKYLQEGNGEYAISDAALCISVVEKWNGYAFRVVASVIVENDC
jgi:hypothetical protein